MMTRGPVSTIVRRYPWLALAAVAVFPAAVTAHAQQGQTVVRSASESQFEAEVDMLVQELLTKRRQSMALVQSLQRFDATLRAAELRADQRTQIETAVRQLRTQLVSLDADGRRIRKRLGDICAVDRTPEGWAGVVLSMSASFERHDDGRVTTRFIDYPSIESVEPGSPAEKAGIQGGDLLLSMGGADLRNHEVAFSSLLKPGTRIPFKVRRGVETRQFMVVIEPRPVDFSTPCPWVDERIAAAFAPVQMQFSFTTSATGGSPQVVGGGGAAPRSGTRVIVQRSPAPESGEGGTPSFPVPLPPVPPLPPVGFGSGSATVAFAGAQFIAMNADLADALGVDRGLLVTTVGRGSPAEQSGMRAGDVIISVDGRPLTSPLILLQAVERAEHRELQLQLLRKKKAMSLALSW